MAMTNSRSKRLPVPLKQLLGRAGTVALRDQARWLLRLEKAVHRQLPPPIPEHCRVANLRDRELILQVDSPAWAGRLRFLAPHLQDHLNKRYKLDIHTITFRVRPGNGPVAEQPPVAHRLRLSAQAVKMLTSLGHYHQDALGQALLRLARHGQPPTTR